MQSDLFPFETYIHLLVLLGMGDEDIDDELRLLDLYPDNPAVAGAVADRARDIRSAYSQRLGTKRKLSSLIAEFGKDRSLSSSLIKANSKRLTIVRQICLARGLKCFLQTALLKPEVDYEVIVQSAERVVQSSSLTVRAVKDFRDLMWNFSRLGSKERTHYLQAAGSQAMTIAMHDPEAAVALEFGFEMTSSDGDRMRRLADISYLQSVVEGTSAHPDAKRFSLWASSCVALTREARMLKPPKIEGGVVFDSGEREFLIDVDHLPLLTVEEDEVIKGEESGENTKKTRRVDSPVVTLRKVGSG